MIATALAGLTLTAAALTGTYDPGEPSTYYLLPSDDAMDPVAQCLVGLGWHGIPGDGMPAIYAPTTAIRACGGRVSGRMRHA